MKHRALTVGLVAMVSLVAVEYLAVATAMPIVADDLGGHGLYGLAFSSALATGVIGMVAGGRWGDLRGPLEPLWTGIALFAAGKAPLLVSGPWAKADIEKGGIKYAIQPVPGFKGLAPAKPFAGVQAFFVASKGKNKAFAQEFVANTMNTPEAMQTMFDMANLPPALTALQESAGASDPDLKAYLDRLAHADLEAVRRPLALRSERPVTFGWGPRFLHSTGQLHKGGPPVGVFLQVTDEPDADLDVPGQEHTFGTLVAAQAAGDAQVLADHGRPVLRVHLTDRRAGLEALRAALS